MNHQLNCGDVERRDNGSFPFWMLFVSLCIAVACAVYGMRMSRELSGENNRLNDALATVNEQLDCLENRVRDLLGECGREIDKNHGLLKVSSAQRDEIADLRLRLELCQSGDSLGEPLILPDEVPPPIPLPAEDSKLVPIMPKAKPRVCPCGCGKADCKCGCEASLPRRAIREAEEASERALNRLLNFGPWPKHGARK